MRYTGFEIECITTKEWSRIDEEVDTYDREYDDEYEPKVLGKAKKYVLNIHDDGSVEGDGFPAEVVTQPMLENRRRALKSLCTTIKKRGGYVNKSCGGHIHVDAKDLVKPLEKEDNVVTAVKFLTLCEPALFAVTGKSRLKNSFCNPIHVVESYGTPVPGAKVWETDNLFGDRYWSVNMCSLEEHGTLEFRLFSGTLEHEKWAARAAFAEAVVNKLSEVLKNPKSLEKLHKNSALAGLDLEEVIDGEYDKSKLYHTVIKNNGPKLVEEVCRMVGLHSRHRKALVKQHLDIWGKYAKKDAA